MTTLFEDFMVNATLRKIAQGDVAALRESVQALEAQIAAEHRTVPVPPDQSSSKPDV